MTYPLSARHHTITDASGEIVAHVEPGPFAIGYINARDLVELANLGYRTRQHEADLRNLAEIKGEPSFAFSPSVMVEFTKEEFANFQTGLGALRHLAGRTEAQEEKKVEPAPTEVAEGYNDEGLTNEQVGIGFKLLSLGDRIKATDEWWNFHIKEWLPNTEIDEGDSMVKDGLLHRRRIS